MAEPFRVFYSWQSDLPRASAQDFIRRSLDHAARLLNEKQSKVEIVIDEATRGEAGSPDIFRAICEKVSKAEVFVGDVSTVRKAAEGERRAFQNPNVLIELGYALAELGYPRMILLCNRQFTDVPGDLPFDLDRRRVTPFSPDADSKPALSEKRLGSILASAIETVLLQNPVKARLRSLEMPDAVKRVRDAEHLKDVLSLIHGPSLVAHIQDVPWRINQATLDYWYDLDAWVQTKVHMIADERLRECLIVLHDHWARTIEHSYDYDADRSGRYAHFYNPGDMPLSEERQARWDATLASAAGLRESWLNLCAYVRDNYVEVDLNACSRSAQKRHQRTSKTLDGRWGFWRTRLQRLVRLLTSAR